MLNFYPHYEQILTDLLMKLEAKNYSVVERSFSAQASAIVSAASC
jgi:hypothetical protein